MAERIREFRLVLKEIGMEGAFDVRLKRCLKSVIKENGFQLVSISEIEPNETREVCHEELGTRTRSASGRD